MSFLFNERLELTPKRDFPKSFLLYDNPVLSLKRKLKNFQLVGRAHPLSWLGTPGNPFRAALTRRQGRHLPRAPDSGAPKLPF